MASINSLLELKLTRYEATVLFNFLIESHDMTDPALTNIATLIENEVAN